jgi:hypothetical protein
MPSPLPPGDPDTLQEYTPPVPEVWARPRRPDPEGAWTVNPSTIDEENVTMVEVAEALPRPGP